jgi:hypothetical protein
VHEYAAVGMVAHQRALHITDREGVCRAEESSSLAEPSLSEGEHVGADPGSRNVIPNLRSTTTLVGRRCLSRWATACFPCEPGRARCLARAPHVFEELEQGQRRASVAGLSPSVQ